MELRFVTANAILIFCTALANAAPTVELELATERGVQITAPREWLQLLAAVGIENVRIRGMKPGDEPQVANRGTAERPSYRVIGVITARDQLRLPGGTFSRSDRGRLKDYFERLAADGAEALTAPRGLFGLTDKEMKVVFADLARPIDFETKGQPLHAVVDRVQSRFAMKLVVDAEAERLFNDAKPVADEMTRITTGTSLAIVLRRGGLVLRPEKTRGQPVVYRVAPADANAIAQSTLGKPDDKDMQRWPIGWEPHESPGKTAPALFELLNAEIDGYTLAEALAAIGPRVKAPFYFDQAALEAHNIDPAKIQVRLARTRTSYKRVIDRVLSQARLGSQVRVDEAGTPFLWITR